MEVIYFVFVMNYSIRTSIYRVVEIIISYLLYDTSFSSQQMQDIREDNRRGSDHSASEVVGFFYSPVIVNTRSSKRTSKQKKYRHPVPEFAQTK